VFISTTDIDLDFISQQFQNFQFKGFSTPDKFINCIACFAPQGDLITSEWKQIQNVIAGTFTPTEPTAKWNLYLAFFCNETLEIRAKYQIQNDKFCCRKIIFDSFPVPFDDIATMSYLGKELLGLDLSKTEHNKESEPYTCAIADLLENVPLGPTTSEKEKRNDVIASILGRLSDEN